MQPVATCLLDLWGTHTTVCIAPYDSLSASSRSKNNYKYSWSAVRQLAVVVVGQQPEAGHVRPCEDIMISAAAHQQSTTEEDQQSTIVCMHVLQDCLASTMHLELKNSMSRFNNVTLLLIVTIRKAVATLSLHTCYITLVNNNNIALKASSAFCHDLISCRT